MPEPLLPLPAWCWNDSDTAIVQLDDRFALLTVDTTDDRVTADVTVGELDAETFVEIIGDISAYVYGRPTQYWVEGRAGGSERALLAGFAMQTIGAV